MRLAGLSVATILVVIFRIARSAPPKIECRAYVPKSQSEPQHNAIASAYAHDRAGSSCELRSFCAV